MAMKRTKIRGTADTTAMAAKPVKLTSRDSFYNTKSYAPTNAAATSLTAQQKAERGRTKERKIAKMDPISKSTVRGVNSVPVPSKNKNPGKFVR